MVFFMDAKERVYARYGGRDAHGADNRQSLDGLRYTMQSVATMHERETKEYAPKVEGPPVHIREIPGGGGGGKCLHCHQVKEKLNRSLVAAGASKRDLVYRYPLPENLGLRLEVNRGNVIEKVSADSAAAKAGLKPGDVIERLGATPIHSFGDATFALDKAPRTGELSIRFLRGQETLTAKLSLTEGWRKTDIRWRPSLRRLVPSMPLSGDDLTAAERKSLGLTGKQLAFRQSPQLRTAAKKAGFEAGDIITDVDGRKLQLSPSELRHFVEREYLVGDTVRISILRNGKTQTIPLTLGSR